MKHYNVVAAVVMHDGEVLCMQKGRTKYDYTSFHWEFPGGKIEEGETPEEALHRELLEEMEYDVCAGEHIVTVEYDYPKFHLTMHCFLCSIVSGKLCLLEHEDARWLGMDELDSVRWLPADMGVIRELSIRVF